MSRPYVFHEDPGHGWLQVPEAKLVELGITARISNYSFQSRDRELYVYLEEDGDLSHFLNAELALTDDMTRDERREKVKAWWDANVSYEHHNGDAPCRSYPRYRETRT